jgi:hypothetical protein
VSVVDKGESLRSRHGGPDALDVQGRVGCPIGEVGISVGHFEGEAHRRAVDVRRWNIDSGSIQETFSTSRVGRPWAPIPTAR